MKIIIKKTNQKRRSWRTDAFTLLESLLVLSLISFLTLVFSAQLIQTLHLVKGELFVLKFEELYKRTQEDAALEASVEYLGAKNGNLLAGQEKVTLPKEVKITDFTVKFDAKGENSSLQKIKIYLPYESKAITYQMEMGSGKYKKQIN
ncbi:competence type IV pilus minor pilin ComGD [Lactococcus kimchii]|uniref:competence type IV pilus minor pilin ComGD n=1 Tax=Lactococcus sp. S-13 TaxID=2507158 RepID=UPI001023EA0F|nr:competence type IV pilus minor pilin ComGD [Lactococcus sp. S-13]RZI49277.1 competence protein [Lactococcus sp. S-13]